MSHGAFLKYLIYRRREMNSLELLPEDCSAYILSLTSPKDACSASLVSSSVRSSADSDAVWEKFLPSDYQEILSRLVSPLTYSSKKELFLRLCNPHLIDGGRKVFSIEKSTGKKRYMLSARELSITWASNPLYWSWKSFIHSRFSEVVELRTIWWLQIQGKFNTKMLSPNTVYGAYLIVQIADRAYGLDTLPSEISIQVGNFKSLGKVYLRRQDKNKRALLEQSYFLNQIEAVRSKPHAAGGGESTPFEREDGWVEIELGSFCIGGGDDDGVEVEMCLKEVTGVHLKAGLIIEGIELRPMDGLTASAYYCC